MPVMCVVPEHWGGVSLGSGSDQGALLATIGDVMKAIFTVGSLIIALISACTHLSMEDAMKSSFEVFPLHAGHKTRIRHSWSARLGLCFL
jgi:hypothetical protein